MKGITNCSFTNIMAQLEALTKNGHPAFGMAIQQNEFKH